MKKVLIITYYWPPCGGVSVLRNLKFAKYLKHFGWEPVIYAPENAQYDVVDQQMGKEVDDEINVIRQPILEPFELFKKLSGRKTSDTQNPLYVRDKKKGLVDQLAIWVRANFFIPDARSLWIKPSVRYLKKYLKEHPVDAILTSGPPHTDTVIGMKVSRALNIPWFAFFKDPWTQVDYYKMFPIGRLADSRHRKLEQAVFKQASKIGIASKIWSRDLEAIGASNVETIYFGYDEDDFSDIRKEKESKFSIVHAGLLGYDRKPDVLLKVLSDLKKENPQFAENLVIRLAGRVDYSIINEIKNLGLGGNAVIPGSIPRKKALEMIVNGNVLLLPLNKADNAEGRLPGKLFELLRTGNPVLCLGPSNAEAAIIINETNAGTTIAYDNYNELKAFIQQQFKQFLDGVENTPSPKIEKYSNFHQTQRLATFLDTITLQK